MYWGPGAVDKKSKIMTGIPSKRSYVRDVYMTEPETFLDFLVL